LEHVVEDVSDLRGSQGIAAIVRGVLRPANRDRKRIMNSLYRQACGSEVTGTQSENPVSYGRGDTSVCPAAGIRTKERQRNDRASHPTAPGGPDKLRSVSRSDPRSGGVRSALLVLGSATG
jgi:hypothetical protein